MIYQVSYVVVGGAHPGAIVTEDDRPQVGDRIRFDGHEFEIAEVVELLPPRDDLAYIHVTCKPTGAGERKAALGDAVPSPGE